jgi:sec-independent protein translocase protein TatC
MPLVVMYLARFGVVRAGQLLRWWRYAIVAIAVIAAVVTPTIDPVTMSLVMAPMIVLYFLGIILALFVQPRGGKPLLGG